MKRYYDTATHTETHIASETTIPSDDVRVAHFFKPLEQGKRLVIVNDLPTIEDIPQPTQADIDARALADALAENNATYETQVNALTKDYPQSEINTWTKQEAEARAWLLDNTHPTPFIDALATSRGVDKAILVDKIIVKADAFSAALGQLTGARQAAEDLILGV